MYIKVRTFVLILIISFLGWGVTTVKAAGLSSWSVYPFPFLNQLPSNDMSRIFQDKDGLIWMGTADGLCRYDGYNVHVFRSGPSNSSLLPNNNVRSLAETKDGKLLVGTLKGLSVFDKVTNHFTTLELDKELSDYEIRSIVVDREGYCWLGSYKKLFRLSPDLKSVKSYDKVLPITSVNCVYMDRMGTIYVGFWNKGLYRYDRRRDTFSKMPVVGREDNPFRIFEDKDGRYWVSTWGEGIFSIEPGSRETAFRKVQLSGPGVKANSLKNVFGFVQDRQNGYLWMTDLEGLTVAEIKADGTLTNVESNSLLKGIDPCFNDIIIDCSGNIWLASVSVGGYMLSSSGVVSSALQLPSIASMTGGLQWGVTALYEDVQHTLWLSQDRWGLGWYKPATQSLVFYRTLPGLSGDSFLSDIADIMTSPTNEQEVWVAPRFTHFIYVFGLTGGVPSLKQKMDLNSVHAGNPIVLYRDNRRFAWVLTQGGIVMVSPSGKLRKLKVNFQDMSSITGDDNGHIYIGTDSNGLYELTLAYGNDNCDVRSIKTFNVEQHQLPGNDIKTVCFDRYHRRLWMGTMEGHVVAMDMNEHITDYSEQFAAYANAIIQNISVDKFGHVWVSTTKNVVEYEPRDNSMRAYPVEQETGMTSFVPGASFYNGGDYIYYGGRGGIARFGVRNNSLAPTAFSKAIVTDMKVRGVSILDGTLSDDYQLVPERHKLVLGPDARDIEISFSTLNYAKPGRISYAYRIKGVNNDWVYPKGDFPRAYFNDLSKGTYKLEIRTTDENGKWSDQVQVYTLVRLPAWYETWWAYTLYIIVLAAVGYYAYRVVRKRMWLKNELRIAKIENEKNEELTQAKLRYFTNVSHDFLTPISIISCLIDDIGMTYKTKIPQLDKMHASLFQLKRLLQQVLDFRKLENGKMKLSVSKGELVAFVKNVCRENFEPLMARKRISFALNLEVRSFPAWFDEDKLEKVLYNLLSNAYKYTAEGGAVTVSLSSRKDEAHTFVIIRVKDTGQGISKEDCERIFNRFYTANHDKTVESNGIGLALVKELVELHHASIKVESEVGKGTAFTIVLPVDEASYKTEEKVSPQTTEDIKDLELTDTPVENVPKITGLLQPSDKEEKPDDSCMLLVDDNQDLLDVMERIFSRHRRVLLAHNGVEALSVIGQNSVDIVVSDVMMPEMDGLELCRCLKSDLETSHIPVILLTAKNSPEDRVDCYKAGADGYIAKPFELNVLEARIENFLKRKTVRQTEFKSNPEKKTDSLKMSPLDQKFLDKITGILDKNMAKSNDIDMELLTQEIGMSKSSFYRKMKSITGLSPIEFIKNYRLKRAYALLENGATSITDVAYASGFTSAKYFATCFKEEFGMPPSEFLKRNQ